MDFGIVEKLQEILPEMIYDIPIFGEVNFEPFIIALIIIVGLSLIFKLIQVVVLVYLKKLAKKTSTGADDVVIDAIAGIRSWVYITIATYIAIQPFEMASWLDQTATFIFLFVVIWQLIEVVVTFSDYVTIKFLEKDEDGDGEIDPGSTTVAHLIGIFIRVALWAFGILFMLSNMGIEVTALVAGLGIGGIAIAFALQGILADLFTSFSIYFDKPFQVGDFITLGTDSGTVEKIGIMTTRIKTLQGEELIVSNNELTSVRINNFKKMDERRISTKIGVTYETPHEQVKEIPKIIERLFESESGARLDRVHFTEFGDSALIFDFVYYVHSSDYADYLDIQQRVNHDILDKFAELNIEFAYPTQTLHMKKTGG